MRLPLRQVIWLALLLLINIVFWVIPSDTVELIARDRHILLGRYSRTHFFWIIGLAVFLMLNLYTDLVVDAVRRRRQFQVYAVLLTGIPTILLVDFLLRDPQSDGYVREHAAYSRRANITFSVEARDKPDAPRTYPNAPPGYRMITCTYHTDRRGYRNQTDLETYDVVALGDSFTEGSHVSDDHAWPVRLSKRSGLSVYNLGMSGYTPLKYAMSLAQYGLDLKPRYVVCMLYEGNDFRSAASSPSRTNPSLSKRLKTYSKQSPILSALDRAIVGTLGFINADSPIKGIELLDWLPLAIPDGENANHYAFAPKQLRDLYRDAESFERSTNWRAARDQLSWMHKECLSINARFVLVFAPSKAHVTLPAKSDQLPAAKVARFTAMSYKGSMPNPDAFLKKLLENINAQESVVRRWCVDENVAFVSLTEALREAAIAGTQVYFTYDQHWTPEGHRVAAEVIANYLSHDRSTSRSSGDDA